MVLLAEAPPALRTVLHVGCGAPDPRKLPPAFFAPGRFTSANAATARPIATSGITQPIGLTSAKAASTPAASAATASRLTGR